MTGGNFLSPDMEVPDTMDVSMSQSEKLLFTWNSMFGNRYFGEGDDLVLGNKARSSATTATRSATNRRTSPGGRNPMSRRALPPRKVRTL